MRAMLLSAALSVSSLQSQPAVSPQPLSELAAALRGSWVGVLEYRDYSEPVGSTKRVDLPTWLTISGDTALSWHYIYDDGPTKTVQEDDNVLFDTTKRSFSEASNGKPAQVFRVDGFEGLKAGRGTLQMVGSGTDSGKPAEIHLTMTVRRNLLEILEEVRPTGSTEPYAFRHLYRMVRAKSPALP
ncbi:hypothetical protein [Terriglobus roseus]|uniref:THAP4-like heme-binding beta-barrel domain-containing protein n=1 Tax=Terriglobus roseus TaxID=392734 RepID=A0A1H4KP07_9BACT|nr:hypothetical protein [Terriglobus roseus]SEB59848.1 hypothetical protein SAMN05443244_1276 [Terriglobus roseus]